MCFGCCLRVLASIKRGDVEEVKGIPKFANGETAETLGVQVG